MIAASELVAVDLFAGLGGWTCAAEALGIRVAWAANHWPLACEIHGALHPSTTHACQDLHQVDPAAIPPHNLLIASPACQGNSTASQPKRRPKHDGDRSTAWAVLTVAEYHRPPFVVVENVAGILGWVLYPAWRTAMAALGYAVEEHVLDAADSGVPQHRERVFIVCTHRGSWTSRLVPLGLRFEARAHVAARDFLDLDGGSWEPVARPGRGAGVLGRVARGRARFGGEPFLTHSGWGLHSGRSLDRPIGTITTIDAQWGLVRGDLMRGLSLDEYLRAMSLPATYRPALDGLPRHLAVKLIGNAVAPTQGAHVLSTLLAAA